MNQPITISATILILRACHVYETPHATTIQKRCEQCQNDLMAYLESKVLDPEWFGFILLDHQKPYEVSVWICFLGSFWSWSNVEGSLHPPKQIELNLLRTKCFVCSLHPPKSKRSAQLNFAWYLTEFISKDIFAELPVFVSDLRILKVPFFTFAYELFKGRRSIHFRSSCAVLLVCAGSAFCPSVRTWVCDIGDVTPAYVFFQKMRDRSNVLECYWASDVKWLEL